LPGESSCSQSSARVIRGSLGTDEHEAEGGGLVHVSAREQGERWLRSSWAVAFTPAQCFHSGVHVRRNAKSHPPQPVSVYMVRKNPPNTV
jgi:hypothetical protein